MSYRGSFRRDDPDRAQKFADLVDPAIAAACTRAKGMGLPGLSRKPSRRSGGRSFRLKGYLAAVYEKIRAAGGVCIADEVQTGLGRSGRRITFGFEHQGACA